MRDYLIANSKPLREYVIADRWLAQYGGMKASDAKRLKELGA